VSSGREFIHEPPARWPDLHRARRPETLAPYESALGRLLARVLAGEPLVALAPGDGGDDGPARIRLQGLSEEDRAVFARLVVPEADERHVPSGGLDLAAIRLPEVVRREPRWTMSAAGLHSYVELTSLDAVVCVRLIAPLMSDLAYVLRLRAGDGAKSAKGRADRLARCRASHDVLGIERAQIDVLLDPDLRADDVVAARMTLITGWSEYPSNLGERAMALLCGRLAQAYYGKARKDGTVEAARVLTTSVTALLTATLGDWPALVEYLGEEQASADATPVETPKTTLPEEPPPQVAERLQVLREWWAMYDARHAAQRAGLEPLDDLVPIRWDYGAPDENGRRRERLARRALAPELRARIEALWGSQVLERYPEALVHEPRPLGIFAELVQPAAAFWDELSLTAWFSCFGPYSRRSLDQLEAFQRNARQDLADLGAPVDASLYRELAATGAEYPFLLEQQVFAAVEISINLNVDEEGQPTIQSSVGEPRERSHPEAFEALRETITRYRRAWLERYLERYLDELWRRELDRAADAYWKRLRGRGRAPTVKQALPDLRSAAHHWFGADHGELARLLGLKGPITASPAPSPRALPSDLDAVRREVAQRLALAVKANEAGRDPEYDLQRLAQEAWTVLIAWQATGVAPPRSAVYGSSFRWMIEQTFDLDLDQGYRLLLDATRHALEIRDHPAAASMVVE
jgi:hypothetical protein